jgi:SAM-dependent methyltransferase
MQPTKAVLQPIAPTVDSSQVYAGPEFERWAGAEGLIAPERFLIEHYLRRDGRILEAGAGGGRILRALTQLGFEHISGFDNVPDLIEQARRHDPSRAAAYRVLDARDVTYQDGEFDQIVYLQQIISFISDAEGRQKAVAEAYRVLKADGIALFSFLCFESRLQSAWHRAMIGYLACFRALARRRQSAQSMPWLWLGGRFNLSAILDRPPHVYWFRCEDAVQLLAEQRFTIVGIGTRAQTEQQRLCGSVEELRQMPMDGMLYVVCRK